ncbi:hypothetical protein EIN_231560 [Entamoeba invadens IP1]|uniref:Uncharacterized protein n=1 Tax=Entamoeba invadens IP1 TaxID=370355 RepID=L7FMR5_ENTIV|nr:hypothetical protein EIN_231560 [Entamoeba invadens IP1]ELP91776.1 hypothetical protein EIN_231560 [Entamoeba invadens IP1]|eukprot:XP_004258547.1 hypothetical protein EIN_231560 [Entamoeba invadens IP1]
MGVLSRSTRIMFYSRTFSPEMSEKYTNRQLDIILEKVCPTSLIFSDIQRDVYSIDHVDNNFLEVIQLPIDEKHLLRLSDSILSFKLFNCRFGIREPFGADFLNIQTFNLNGVDKGRFCIKAPHLKTIFIENSMEVIFDKMCEFQQLEVVQVCKSCTIKFKTNCTTKVKRIICSEATSTSIHMEIPEVQNVSISQCTTLKISKLKLEKLNTEIYIRNSYVKFDGFESKIDKIEFYYSENKNNVIRNDCNEFCGLSKFVPMSLGSVVTKNIIPQSEYHKDLDYEMLISFYFWDKMGYTQNITYINSTGKSENYNSNDLKYFEISVEGLSCVSLGVVSSTYYLFKYLMVGDSFYWNGF